MPHTQKLPVPVQLNHDKIVVRTLHESGILIAEIPVEDIDTLTVSWQMLSQRVADPNVFFEPWFFLSALKHLGKQQTGWHLLAVFQETQGIQEQRLIGFFPFVESRGPLGLKQLTLWKHDYAFLTTPLVEKFYEEQVVAAVAQHIQKTLGHVLLHLPVISGDGPFRAACNEQARVNLKSIYHKSQHSRAILKQSHDWQADLDATINGHHKREFRRQHRRLEALGDLEFRCMLNADSVYQWVKWFVDLEAKGWKANQGTALLQHASDHAFFAEMVTKGAEQNKVQMMGLFLNGEPIALKCNLISVPGSFAFKIAYDESLAKLSPGVQLEIENMRHFAAHPKLQWMDSCAAPGHPMINRLWRERRPVDDVLISSGNWMHELVLGAMPCLRSLNRIRKKLR